MPMKNACAPKSPLLITAIQLGLMVLSIYYTFIGGQTAQGIYDHRWRLITLWLSTLIIGGWLLGRLLASHKIPRTPLDLPFLFLLILWILSTIFSVNPVYSQETLFFFVIYLFFFYIAVDLGRRPWLMELSFNAIIGTSGLVWILALLQLFWWYQELRDVPALLQNSELALALPRLSVLGNPNLMASYVTLVLPLVLYKLTVVKKFVTRALLVLWAILLLGAILFTQSRGGVIGLIVAVSFWIAVWVVQKTGATPKELADKSIWLKSGHGIRLLLLVAIAILGFLIWLTLNFRSLETAIDVRQQVMAGALKTLRKHPVLGAGPGTLGEELIRHQQPLDYIWADAHNLFLTLVAETGLVGAIGLLWVGGISLKILLSNFRQADKSQWSMAGLTCAAALLGFITHNMVDSLFKFPLIMLLAASLAGFWLSTQLPLVQNRESLASKSWGSPAIAIMMVVLVANMAMGMSGLQNIRAYNQAVQVAEQGDWQTAFQRLKAAQQLAPNVPFYQRQLGFAAGYLSEQEPPLRKEAITWYQTALSEISQLSIDHANLSCLLWADGRQAEALQEIVLAQQLEPNNLLYRLNLGYYLELRGDYEAAWNEYAQIVAAHPAYLQSSYWYQTGQRAEALPAIIHRAIQNLSSAQEPDLLNLTQLYLYTGDFEAAWQIQNDDEAERFVNLTSRHVAEGISLSAMQRFDEAKAAFEAAVQIDAKAGEAYLYLSKIALTQKNMVEAEQNIEAALFLERNPDTLYQAALVAEATGNKRRAIELYEEAFAQLTVPTDPNLSRYATEVARRRPWPVAYLPCLIHIYRTELLVQITLAEAALLEQQEGYLRANQVYRRLLSYEPMTKPLAAKLESLCQQHMEICGD